MKLRHFGSFACTLAFITAHSLAQASPISFNASSCVSGSVTTSAITCVTKVANVNYSSTTTAWSAPNTGTGKFAAATMGYYTGSGIGIHAAGELTTGSEHAVDNKNGTDAFLINFSASNFALNQISIGWFDGDADVSILRYNGTQAPTLGNSTVASLDSEAGWDWVGDYSSLSTAASGGVLNFNNTGDVKTGNWWLVSAYNSAYSTVPVSGTFGDGNDYFKLNGFGGQLVTVTPPPLPPVPPTKVPEPASFALFGIALVGFAAARRKWQAK